LLKLLLFRRDLFEAKQLIRRRLPRTVFDAGKAPRTVYEDGKLVRQWELVLRGDDLRVVRVI